MSSSQLLSLDFETKAPSYMDSMDPSFSYMENGGLEYLQYPPQSPTTFELSVGRECCFSIIGLYLPLSLFVLVPSSSPLAFNNALTLSGEYTYSPSFNTASPERSYTPPEGPSLSPPALSYNLSGGDVVPEVPSGRHSRNSSAGSAAGVSYAATVPRSHRFNPIGVAANRPTLRARRRSSKTSDDGHIEAAGLDAEEEDDEEFQPPPLANSQANNDAYVSLFFI